MGISIPQLLIILAILILIFGTKRLRNIGGDLGSAVKGFRKAMGNEEGDAKKDADKLEQKDADFDMNADVKTDAKDAKDKHQS
ncbi:twin-arginine translocase TatA/TatE family subunit [Parendozoicomonas haliclonae]|uniref:Sec-independent protein translocase protein TatA n=1 Tax=Parendozoicomonas haliclonae TaxID=1960125 RepID=A0A1X7AFB9_9GAMM|nr:twin-arginine translocase TatA/TatE family subunit [Parendozoicomonas haliclonae]SMA35843.1 Sec-independent protein translocase protein TatA [Parendozoicomonas haliclonae]